MAGSITKEDQDFVETWEHISPQQWGIIRLDARGEDRHVIISGRQRFKLTTEERIITQDRIKTDENDPFLNGCFRPVLVPDSITIQTNPNALSDEEITRILVSSDIAWGENLAIITSVATVRRMLEVAEDLDDMKVKRLRQLERHLGEIRGVVRIETKDDELKRFLGDKPSGSRQTSTGDANPRRGESSETPVGGKRTVGGRSSDYR